MSAIILLSSDEEAGADSPPKKRIKPTLVQENVEPDATVKEERTLDASAFVISSDEESAANAHYNLSSITCKTEDLDSSVEGRIINTSDHNSEIKLENHSEPVDVFNNTNNCLDAGTINCYEMNDQRLLQPNVALDFPNEVKISNVCTSQIDDLCTSLAPDSANLHASEPYQNIHDTEHKVLPENDDRLSHGNEPSTLTPAPVKEEVPQESLAKSSRRTDSSDSESSDESESEDESRAQTSSRRQTVDEMEAFLKTCFRSVKRTRYESLKEKFPALNNLYQNYIVNNGYNDEVITFLRQHTVEAAKSPADAVLTFNEVMEYFQTSSVEEIQIPPEYKKKVKILLKTCIKLIHRIKKLECSEVDWDDDNNSAYIQEDRYKQRLVKVFNLYCKHVKMNPYQGRLTYRKLNCSASKYKEINTAINKNFHKQGKFPSYREVEQVIRKCIKKHGLPLSESRIKKESEKCFKIVGRFLQKRRKQELYESHFHFIKDTNDPASVDEQLDKCLKRNFSEGMRKIEMICERYAEKQMEQSCPDPSEDESVTNSSSDGSDSS